ncbi:MAG: hypothetical protein AAF847_13015 [Bacteroidota bacterium]
MKIVINLILLLIAIALGFILVNSIKEPIAFQETKDKRREAVVNRLMDVRRAQEMYRDITGTFAPNFDTLKDVLQNGRFTIVKIVGDEDDPENPTVSRDTSYKPAIDSVMAMGLNLDSLAHVPYSNATFKIEADTLTYQQTLVSVVEVGTQWSTFMGKYASRKYARYDNTYDPGAVLKFGDMNSPKLAGNWESK